MNTRLQETAVETSGSCSSGSAQDERALRALTVDAPLANAPLAEGSADAFAEATLESLATTIDEAYQAAAVVSGSAFLAGETASPKQRDLTYAAACRVVSLLFCAVDDAKQLLAKQSHCRVQAVALTDEQRAHMTVSVSIPGAEPSASGAFRNSAPTVSPASKASEPNGQGDLS